MLVHLPTVVCCRATTHSLDIEHNLLWTGSGKEKAKEHGRTKFGYTRGPIHLRPCLLDHNYTLCVAQKGNLGIFTKKIDSGSLEFLKYRGLRNRVGWHTFGCMNILKKLRKTTLQMHKLMPYEVQIMGFQTYDWRTSTVFVLMLSSCTPWSIWLFKLQLEERMVKSHNARAKTDPTTPLHNVNMDKGKLKNNCLLNHLAAWRYLPN